MVTVDDISDAILIQLAATEGYSTQLPGQAFLNSAPDTPAAYPYAVFTLAGAPKENFSGGMYIQRWTLSIAAYVPIGENNAITPPSVEQFLNSALVTTAAQTALRETTLRNANDLIRDIKPATDTSSYAPELRQGEDVMLCGLTAEILVQGDRSVS